MSSISSFPLSSSICGSLLKLKQESTLAFNCKNSLHFSKFKAHASGKLSPPKNQIRKGLNAKKGKKKVSCVSSVELVETEPLLAQEAVEEDKKAKKKLKKEKKEKEKNKTSLDMVEEDDSSDSDDEMEKAKELKDEVKDEVKDEEVKEEVKGEVKDEVEDDEVKGEVQEEKGCKGKKKMKKQEKYSKKLKNIKFAKYQGLGNDFILIDNLGSAEPMVSASQAKQVCDRNFGIGADGIIFALPGKNSCDFTMRIFNSDGSEPEMCGNGIRCLAKFVAEIKKSKLPTTYSFWTLAGPIIVDIREDGQVKVDMGLPILTASEIPTTLTPIESNSNLNSNLKTSLNLNESVIDYPLLVENSVWKVTCVSMGNPHCITFTDAEGVPFDLQSLDLENVGPKFEHNSVFPARINTEFVQVLSPNELRMRVWERGAGATLACGTGACALVVAGAISNRTERSCLVHLPGGPLEIEWSEKNDHVYMTGPAEKVFYGKLSIQDKN